MGFTGRFFSYTVVILSGPGALLYGSCFMADLFWHAI